MTQPLLPAESVALTLLRRSLNWKQEELADALGISKSVVNDQENGRSRPDADRLEEVARVLGLPPEAASWSSTLVSSLQSSARLEHSAGPGATARQGIEALALRAGQRLTDFLRQWLTEVTTAEAALRACLEAEGLWVRLRRKTDAQQRLLIEADPAFHTSAMMVLLCDKSVEAAADRPERALKLAQLAHFVALRVPGPDAWQSRVQAFAWAHLANARRVSGNLDGAEVAFQRAKRLWKEGALGDPSRLLSEGQMLLIEVSLRKDQRQLPAALKLADKALRQAGPDLRKKVLLNQANILELLGRYEEALQALDRVAPLLDRRREPRLFLVLRFDQAVNLCHLDRFTEAEALVREEVRPLAIAQRQEMDLVRLLWLQGRLEDGLGRPDGALAAFEQVQRELIAHGMLADTGLVMLDQAMIYCRQGRQSLVKALASQMLPILEAQKINPEGMAAALLFREAAEQERATADLARRLRDYLDHSRYDAKLRFSG
jgi:transcriptional regulator with XRE-family HTH domain